MAKKQNKRKLEDISESDSSSEEEVEIIEEEESTHEDVQVEQSLHNCIIFDFRNSKSVIQCSREINTIRKLTDDHIQKMLKEKLIVRILAQVTELMGENFNNELMKGFKEFLNNNLQAKKAFTQFTISKNTNDEMNLMFFECLEEMVQGWTKSGLEGVVNEPVQCLMTGTNSQTMEFESSFIIIYAKKRTSKKFAFKFLICKNTDTSVWSFVGGKKSQPSETSEECCLREMREELYGYSLDSVENSVGTGPIIKFETNYIYAHEVEWEKTDEITTHLLENYKNLKKDNKLMTFNAKEISVNISQENNYLDSFLELLKQYQFTEEICDYKFIDSKELCKLKGGRSNFLKKLYKNFIGKISKTGKFKKVKKTKKKK